MDKKIMYELIHPYRCKNCGQDMLFFTTSNDTVIDYKEFLNRGNTLSEMKRYLERRNIRFLKCLCCNKLYIIDWTDDWPQQVMYRNVPKQFGL